MFIFIYHFFIGIQITGTMFNQMRKVWPLCFVSLQSGNVWESLRRISFVPDLYHHGVSTFGSQKKTLKLCSCVGSTSTMIWVCVAETGFLSLRMRVFPSVKLSLLLSLYKALISPFLRLQPPFFCPLSWEILSIISFKFLCLLFTSTTIVLTSS